MVTWLLISAIALGVVVAVAVTSGEQQIEGTSSDENPTSITNPPQTVLKRN